MAKNKKNLLIIGSVIAVIIIIIAIIFINKNGKTVTSGKDVIDGFSEVEVFKVVKPISHNERVKLLQKAQKTNELAYMWLTIPGTNINTPVIFDPDHDNAYWEDRTLDNKQVSNRLGDREETVTYAHFKTIFPDAKNSSDTSSQESKNIVLFGHNWNNVSLPYVIGDNDDYIMFEQLVSFSDLRFSKGHQYIYSSSLEEEKVWQVFSVMYTDTYWKDQLGFNYFDPNPSDENFGIMLQEMQDRSLYDFGVEVNTTDQILTLSTCTRYYEEHGDNQRFVVCAKLLDKNESDSKLNEVSKNDNIKLPYFITGTKDNTSIVSSASDSSNTSSSPLTSDISSETNSNDTSSNQSQSSDLNSIDNNSNTDTSQNSSSEE